jgi:hypothetical protein
MATRTTSPEESDPNAKTDHDSESPGEQATEEQKVREAQSLDAKTTYEVIRREGEKELDRSTDALFWSGLAAGLSMGFSFWRREFSGPTSPTPRGVRWSPSSATASAFSS